MEDLFQFFILLKVLQFLEITSLILWWPWPKTNLSQDLFVSSGRLFWNSAECERFWYDKNAQNAEELPRNSYHIFSISMNLNW